MSLFDLDGEENYIYSRMEKFLLSFSDEISKNTNSISENIRYRFINKSSIRIRSESKGNYQKGYEFRNIRTNSWYYKPDGSPITAKEVIRQYEEANPNHKVHNIRYGYSNRGLTGLTWYVDGYAQPIDCDHDEIIVKKHKFGKFNLLEFLVIKKITDGFSINLYNTVGLGLHRREIGTITSNCGSVTLFLDSGECPPNTCECNSIYQDNILCCYDKCYNLVETIDLNKDSLIIK